MYYNSPCYYLRQTGMTGMSMNQMQMPQGIPAQQPFGQMPTMPMQPMPMQSMPMQPMMPMMPMDQMGDNVGATIGGSMGAPMGGVTPPPIGATTGTTTGPQPTNIGAVPISSLAGQPVFDTQFTQGYLKTQIGRKVRVEFLLGTNTMQDRAGTLVDVGISYIIINETDTDDLLLCDIYSIKFVRFYF